MTASAWAQADPVPPPLAAAAGCPQVVTTEDYFRKRARRAAMGGHSDNEDAVGPGSGGAWPITHRTDNMAALQPYQAQGQAYPQPQQAYGINPYSPNMHPLQGAPVGQTMQAMQDMRLQLQQQQQLLHQQQLQHMQEQIQQQQEMLKRFTQMQHPPLDLADPAQDRFQPQAVQAQLAQQQPVAQPLTMQDQPQLLQPQCGFQSQAFSSYGGATQAMPPQPDPAPSTQNLQAQLQQLQEQQSLVQQQLDTLQRPS
jgi:hypothetical protein